MTRPTALAAGLGGLLLPTGAGAHGFGTFYTLPVPIWLYVYGASAALLLSFLVVGFCVSNRSVERSTRRLDLREQFLGRALRHPLSPRIGGAIGLLALVLTLVTGFFGVNDSFANLSMTLFWLIFGLGYAYSTAVIGNSFALLNPWLALCRLIESWAPQAFAGRVQAPPGLAWWPALVLYIGFIAFELFGNSRPFSLAVALGLYSLLNLAGAALIGRDVWFRQCEFFAVLFRIFGLMAPLGARGQPPALELRQPFAGLSGQRLPHLSLLLFVLFLLASTAFDGLKNTVPYVRIYWEHVAAGLQWLSGERWRLAELKALYAWWQAGVLLLLPLFYLGVYLLFIELCRRIAATSIGLKELALRFGYSLVPIAFVYHVTHYYTLLLGQGLQIIALASDPFGFGWNLFGTAGGDYAQLPQPSTIWHTQVWLILAGHIASVYLAHVEALRLFGRSPRALLSQLPMLLLMVWLTGFGLWILSLPIQR